MKLIQLCLSLSAIVFLGACQNDEDVENITERPAVNIVANIGNAHTSPSRYAYDASNDAASFIPTDQIGVFMKSYGVSKYTLESDGWSADPAMYWDDLTTAHQFYAFYPYNADATQMSVPMPSLNGQTGSHTDLANFDFLVASTSETYSATNNGQISLNFKHVSSLLKLTFNQNKELDGAKITGITIEGTDIVAKGAYSFGENAGVNLIVGEDEADDILSVEFSNAAALNGLKSYYFIVNGKVKATGSESVNKTRLALIISYTNEENKNCTAKLENFEAAIEAGCIHQYGFRIKDDMVIITGNTIEEWDEGETKDGITITGKENTNTQG